MRDVEIEFALTVEAAPSDSRTVTYRRGGGVGEIDPEHGEVGL